MRYADEHQLLRFTRTRADEDLKLAIEAQRVAGVGLVAHGATQSIVKGVAISIDILLLTQHFPLRNGDGGLIPLRNALASWCA